MKVLFTFCLLVYLNNVKAQSVECAGVIDEGTQRVQICSEESQSYMDFHRKIDHYKVNDVTAIKTLKVAIHIWLGANGEG